MQYMFISVLQEVLSSLPGTNLKALQRSHACMYTFKGCRYHHYLRPTPETGATASISELQLHKRNPANCPLHQEHYDAQQRSECEWRVEGNWLTLQTAVEERLRWNINICFWNLVSYMMYGPGHQVMNWWSPRMKTNCRYSLSLAQHFLSFHWRTVWMQSEKHLGQHKIHWLKCWILKHQLKQSQGG